MALTTKTTLVDALVEKEVFETKKAAREALDAILDTISADIAAGNEVSLSGFGKFYSATQAARSGVAMGVAYETPERQVPKFKAAKQLKEVVAG